MSDRSQPMLLDKGYSVIPSFIDADELRFIAAEVEEVLASPRHVGMSRPGNDLVPLRWNDPVVATMLGSEPRRRRLREVLRANDLKWLSAYVSTKPARSPALWWHQDWWCWDHPISFRRSAAQVAVLCYLTDTNTQNGALRILPASHHRSMALHAVLPEPHGADADSLPLQHSAMSDCPGQITLALKAGDAVVLDYRLLHGTHANETRRSRHCVLLSFIPDWCGLPVEIKAHVIAHPALPQKDERLCGSEYADLLPIYDGNPASLVVNRRPPREFAVLPEASTSF